MSRAGRKPAYQNKEKFYHNPNSVLTKKILEIKHDCLCYRCDAQIEWRKTYRKYKILKEPRRCNGCQEKTVTRAYHTLCNPCARDKGLCAKCAKPCDEASRPRKVSDEEMAHRVEHGEIRERLRRTIMRNWERGLLTNEDIMVIIDRAERGETIDWRDYILDEDELGAAVDDEPLSRAKNVEKTKRIIVPDLIDVTKIKKGDKKDHDGDDNEDGDDEDNNNQTDRKTASTFPSIKPRKIIVKSTPTSSSSSVITTTTTTTKASKSSKSASSTPSTKPSVEQQQQPEQTNEKSTEKKKITVLPKKTILKKSSRNAPMTRPVQSTGPSQGKAAVYKEHEIQDQLNGAVAVNKTE